MNICFSIYLQIFIFVKFLYESRFNFSVFFFNVGFFLLFVFFFRKFLLELIGFQGNFFNFSPSFFPLDVKLKKTTEIIPSTPDSYSPTINRDTCIICVRVHYNTYIHTGYRYVPDIVLVRNEQLVRIGRDGKQYCSLR